MAGKNDFLPFAVAENARVLTNEQWSNPTLREPGHVRGIASAALANKAERQGTVMAAALGALVAACGKDALDDGDIEKLAQALKYMISQLCGGGGGGAAIIMETVIKADGWDENNVQRIAAAAVNENSAVWIQPAPGTEKELIDMYNALDAYDNGQGDSWLELIAYGDLNERDIPVRIIILNAELARVAVTGVTVSPDTLSLEV